MKKTVSANISGQFFHIDEDAYEKLSGYLKVIRHYFSQQEGCDEILNDIESRIAEMLKEKVSDRKHVVTLNDVNEVVKIMGQPEDYLEGADPDVVPPPPVYSYESKRRIFRNPDDKILGGVCGGLGAYFNIDPLWIRLIWVFMVLAAGVGILLYLILWIIIPEAKTASEKLAMRGEPINVDNISKAVKDEMEGVGERIKSSARDFGKKAPADKVRNAVHDTFQLAGTLIGDLFRALVKVFGLIFIALSLSFLIILVLLVFTDQMTFAWNDNGVSWLSFNHLIDYVLPTAKDKPLVYAAIFLMLIAPLTGLLIAGVKMLFNIRYKIPFAGALLGILFLSGVAIATYLGIRTGQDFGDRATVTKSEALETQSDTLYLRMESSVFPSMPEVLLEEEGRTWAAIHKDSLYIGTVFVNVLRSPDSLFHVEKIFQSRGKTRKESSYRAEAISFPVYSDDSLLKIPEAIRIAGDDRIRNQKVKLNIYVPEGKTVFLDDKSADFLDDVKNLQNMHDRRMGDKYWTMTASGLSCLACQQPETNSGGTY